MSAMHILQTAEAGVALADTRRRAKGERSDKKWHPAEDAPGPGAGQIDALRQG
jgi:hypothetical protein